MKPAVFILLLMGALLISCQRLESSTNFQWAQVDESKVRSAVMKMVEEQNLLDNELKAKAETASKNTQKINDEIETIKRNKRDSCFEKHTHKKSKDDPSSKAVEPLFIREGSSVTIVNDPHEAEPLMDCLSHINSDEELRKLDNDIEALKIDRKNLDRYETAMRRIAEDVSRQAIIDFSRQSSYDLITHYGNGDVIYNRNNTVVDATGAVIEFINQNKPDLSVKYYPEN